MLGIEIPENTSQTNLKSVTIDELLGASDFITLACALTETNRHMLSYDQFAKMNDGVYLINVARGPLVNEEALVYSLLKGKVAGAGLDVFETEPLPMESPLRELDQCILGTHNGSNTREAVLRVNQLSIDNLFQGLDINL